MEEAKKVEAAAPAPLVFPTRPQMAKNHKFREIVLYSNHYTLKIENPKNPIKVYAVEIEPEIPADFRRGIQTIVASAKQEIKEWLKNADYYLSGKILFSLGGQGDQKVFAAKHGGVEYSIRLKKVRETSLSSEIFKDNDTAAATRQFINVVIKKILKSKLKYTEWGMNSKFYDTKNKISIKNYNIDIFQGFKTSCEVYSNFTPKLLIDFSSRIVRVDNVNDYIKTLKGDKEELRYRLVGRSVVATYGNYRMYRVDEIDFDLSPKSTFLSDKENKQISYAEYYKKCYNIVIRDMNQPLLLNEARDGRKLYLIPELSHMTGLSDEMRRDFKTMAEVAKYTRLEPHKRLEKIEGVNREIKSHLKNDGITVQEESKITGFKLDFPVLTFGNKTFVPDKGNFQFRDPVLKSASFTTWVCVYHKSNFDDAANFEVSLKKASGAYGIKVASPDWLEVSERSANAWGTAIDNYLKTHKGVQIVVVIIPPPAKAAIYPIVKEICSKVHGVPSQVAVTNTLEKGLSIFSKILLQMNAKVGLPLWRTSLPKNWGKREAMVIGVDVFHNVGRNRKSCIGFSASMDPGLTRFFTKVKMQKGVGQEIMEGLANLVFEAINCYVKLNKKVPDTIILFRDGVGESQIPVVMEVETKKIQEMFVKISPDYKPEFAEIIVTKRINDRFFGESGKFGCSNPQSGTIVARDVVSNHFDYFLVAQDVTMGTCTPTHYNVVCNSTSLTEDAFYELTYNQCFNYYNWSGPIRVPAAVMNAHKSGFLAGQTYQCEAQPSLDLTYYFL